LKLFPRTMYGQILLALWVGLIAAQGAAVWLMLNDRVRFGEGLLGGFAAQRIAGVISILDKAEPADRARLVHALNVPPTHISIDEPWETSVDSDSENAKLFIDRVEHELDRPAIIQVVSIKRAEGRRHDIAVPRPSGTTPESESPGATDPNRRNFHRLHSIRPILVVGQAKLTDGTVVTFRHSLPDPPVDWPLRLLGLLLILGASVALLAAWTVRRLTQPLASLADAATGLATNLERPPLPEGGPVEVAQAARAFNFMQRELKRYLETRAQALAAVSHDLRLPITRLRLRIERIDDEELKQKMDDDLSEMDDMIGGTLEFLRAGSTSEKACLLDINALTDTVAEDMRTIGANINLSGHAAEPISARPKALRRCLNNLIENAHRYGGRVIDVSIIEHSTQLDIKVEDRGPGIPETDIEKVFEPYVRIDVSRAKHTGGSGLGLAIARAIARSHGGNVRLEARPGGGLTAILSLPRTGHLVDATHD